MPAAVPATLPLLARLRVENVKNARRSTRGQHQEDAFSGLVRRTGRLVGDLCWSVEVIEALEKAIK